MDEKIHFTREFDCERKKMRVQRRSNVKGAFVKITESSSGKHTSVIIPESGVDTLIAALRMAAGSGTEWSPGT